MMLLLCTTPIVMVFFALGWNCTQQSKNIHELDKKVMVIISMPCHMTMEKPHMAPVDAINHPIDCNGSILFSINNHLDLPQLCNNVSDQDGSMSLMLFTGMTKVRCSCSYNFNDDSSRVSEHGCLPSGKIMVVCRGNVGIDHLVGSNLLVFCHNMNGDDSLNQKCTGEKISLPQKYIYIGFWTGAITALVQKQHLLW